MVRARIIILSAAVLLTVRANAAWRVVIDPWTTGAVTANAASQEVIESQHNNRLDSINSKQQKLMQYTATMATIKELYKLSMENVSGFGSESQYYVLQAVDGECQWFRFRVTVLCGDWSNRSGNLQGCACRVEVHEQVTR